ncbi:MAG: DUF4115 domain-containing protein [Chloroflexi bacterium]|nr:DUF4115 domain-containing protein [Chloroflexota bacterium]
MLLLAAAWLTLFFIGRLLDQQRTAPAAAALPGRAAARPAVPATSLTAIPVAASTVTSSVTPPAAVRPTAAAATARAPLSGVSPPATSEEVPPAAKMQRVDVELRTLQRTWVRALVDDQVVLEGTLLPGQVRRWSGEQNVSMRIGNAAGVALTVDDEPLSTLGLPNQPVDRTFTPRGAR